MAKNAMKSRPRSAAKIGRLMLFQVARSAGLLFLSAIFAIVPTMIVILIAYALRSPHCSERSFIAAQPFMGDRAINLAWFGVVTALIHTFLIGHILMRFDDLGRTGRLGVWVGRVLGLGALGLACLFNNSAARLCISESDLRHRTTFGGEVVTNWQDIHRVELNCSFGRTESIGFVFIREKGDPITLDMRDFSSSLPARALLTSVIRRASPVITIKHFDPTCPSEFPGLTIP